MPAAKSEDLRWLMVYKRVVEEAPQKAIAAHCREHCQSREETSTSLKKYIRKKNTPPAARVGIKSMSVAGHCRAADASRGAARASDTALIPVHHRLGGGVHMTP